MLRAVLEVQLSNAAEARATGVWLDPSGMHTLVAVVAGNTLGATAEAHYVHARWKRSRPISKLKGVSLTAVGWSAAQVTEASTGHDSRQSVSDAHFKGFHAWFASL